ncbi:MAG TPA: hypothetical protein VJT72_10680 [Pseudonocardiaceae bacterium]|nr:hypothetical protein [Pseudonocardiaceae bacterium]
MPGGPHRLPGDAHRPRATCTPTRLRIQRRWHASWQLREGRVFTVELVGIGVGPGDPDLLTVAQGAMLIAYQSGRRLARL